MEQRWETDGWDWKSACDFHLGVREATWRHICPTLKYRSAILKHNHTIKSVTTTLMSYQMTKIKVPPKDGRKFWGAKNFELEVVNAFDISNAECWSVCIRLAASFFRAGTGLGVPWPYKLTELSRLMPLLSQPSRFHMLPASSTPLWRDGNSSEVNERQHRSECSWGCYTSEQHCPWEKWRWLLIMVISFLHRVLKRCLMSERN